MVTALIGISTPIPMPVGDGTNGFHDFRCSSNVKISPDAKPDSKGILRWPVALQAKEKRKFEIHYQIEYPPTLVVEMKRHRHVAPSPALAPSPLAPRKPYDLRNDIEQLEEACLFSKDRLLSGGHDAIGAMLGHDEDDVDGEYQIADAEA